MDIEPRIKNGETHHLGNTKTLCGEIVNLRTNDLHTQPAKCRKINEEPNFRHIQIASAVSDRA